MAFNQALAAALILNSGYEPIKIVNWQKAMILWLQGKVEILEYHPVYISSPSRSFQLPSVLRLKTYIRPYFGLAVRMNRQNIFIRDNYTCQYCRKKISEKKLTLDHVLPLSRSGPHDWQNVVAACSSCNNKKGNRTPDEAGMKLLTKPIKPKWLPSRGLEVAENSIPPAWKNFLRFRAS